MRRRKPFESGVVRLVVPAALLIGVWGCGQGGHRAATPRDLTRANKIELQQHVGHIVTMAGPFSLRGKVGPFIQVRSGPVYLVSRGSFADDKYENMEGRKVRVTGTLRFAEYPEATGEDLAEGRLSDHFYFEAESARVALDRN